MLLSWAFEGSAIKSIGTAAATIPLLILFIALPLLIAPLIAPHA
jgi:hypothetical protein